LDGGGSGFSSGPLVRAKGLSKVYGPRHNPFMGRA
jgi:hypothetical protein